MPLVVVIGKYLQMYPEINLERLYRYVEQTLEVVCEAPFVMLYVHSEASYSENCPGVLWLRRLYNRLPESVRLNLSSFLVLHCNWSLWLTLLAVCPYFLRDFWGKVKYFSRIELLEEAIQGTLELPQFVLDHDALLEEQPLADYGVYTHRDDIARAEGSAPPPAVL
uniref:Sec14p-like lipid-binding protein n=1 Tax=Tetraselmis sp. GSL018 TaxID=582737 RepID=A0A061RRD0_9CHLO